MRKTLLLMAVLGLAGMLCGADPFVGTWKLNAAKSKVNPPSSAIKSDLVKIEAIDNGLKFTFDRIDAEGKSLHIEMAPKFDGKDYASKGDPTADTVSMTKVDANTFEQISKKAGKEVAKVRVVIARDGKSSTVTAKVKDVKGQETSSTTIYEKQ